MNDIVSTAVTARSPALQQIYQLIAAGASARDADRVHPRDALTLLRRARFSALQLPVDQGGGGGTLRDVIAEAIRLAEADSNVAHIFRDHFTFVERFLVGATGQERQDWRQTVLDGGIVGLATTELDRPRTGGAYPLKTALMQDRDGYRLRGTKYDSIGSLYADLILIRATAAGDVAVSVVVPATREGVEVIDDWDGIGQRVTGSGTTNFHDVRVEPHEVIVDSDNPGYLPPYTGTIAKLFVTAINAGIVAATLRDAKALLLDGGRNSSHAPFVQEAIGRIAADSFAAEAVVLDAADRLVRAAEARHTGRPVDDLVQNAAIAAAKAKVIVDELALRSATALFDVGGTCAVTRGQNLDRHWRNARTLASHNPASYKAQALGAYELHGTRLPTSGFF